MLVKCFSLPVVILYFSTTVIEAQSPAGSCPDGTFGEFNNECFKYVNNYTTFSDAEGSCASIGGHLAVINNSFVNIDIASKVLQLNQSLKFNHGLENASVFLTDDYWIGAHVYTRLSSKPWVWTDKNQLVVYTDWASGQPGGETSGGQCVSGSISDGTWNAEDCSSTKPYVCIVPRIIYNCPTEWIYFEKSKSCYKIFFWANWQDAENVCKDNGAHLASIHNETENNFLVCKLNYRK